MKLFTARFLIASFVTLSAVPLHATTETWNDGGADQSWSDTLNWSGGLVPGVAPYTGVATNTVGYDVIIGTLTTSSIGTPILIDTNSTSVSVPTAQPVVSIGNLTFNDTTGVEIEALTVETLTLTGTTGITNNTAAVQILNIPVTEAASGGSATYAGGTTGGSLNFANSLDIGAVNVTTTGVVNVTTTGTLISTAGTGTITIGDGTTASTATFSGASTYAGGTTVLNAAILVAGASTATSGGVITSGPFGTGSITLDTGSTLEDDGGATTLANSFSLNGNITLATNGGSLDFDGTGLTMPATVVLAGNTALTVNNTTTIADVISGSASLTELGTGTLTLSGVNTYNGGTNLNAGTLVAANTSAFGATGAAVGLSGGTLDLATDTTIKAYTVTVSGNATIDSDKASASSAGITQQLGTLSIGGNTLTIAAGSNVSGGSPAVAFTATTLNSTTGATSILNPTTASLTVTGVTGSATGGHTDTLDLDGTATANQVTGIIGDGAGGGVVALSKTNTGTWALSGANTYSGGTTLSSGTLRLAGSGTLGSASGSLTVNTGGTLDLDGTNQTVGNFTGTGGTILNNATGTNVMLTIGSGNATGGSFAGLIANNSSGTGTVALTKTGTGALALTGAANTFTGVVAVQAGSLSFTTGNASAVGAQSLGENTGLNLGVAGTSSGTLKYTGTGAVTLAKNIGVLGNGTDTIQNSGTGLLTLSGTLTKNGTKLTLNGGAQGITVSGLITGASAGSDLIVTGGTTTLTNTSNNYNGPTFVQGGGTLVDGTGAGAALPTGTTLFVGGADNTTGTFDLSGDNQTIAGLNSQGTGGASNVITNNGATNKTLTVSGGGTFAGKIQNGTTNTTAFTVSGGTMILSGANTYTGATTVTAGTLNVTGSTAAGSAVAVNGGNLIATGTVGGTVMVGNTATLTGIGTTGAVTLASGGTLNPGTVGGIGTLTVGSISFQTGSTFALDMSGSNTDLLTITGAATITGGADISITASGLNQNNYVLATAASGLNSAVFTVTGSLPTGYQLVATPTTLDLQMIAPGVATQTFTSPTPATINIINGHTTTVTASLNNTASSGSNNLNVSLADNGGSGGAVNAFSPANGTTVTAASSVAVSGTFTASTVGTGETWSIKNTDGAATPTSVSTGGTVNVYNHSAPTLAVATGNNQTIITGGSFTSATATLSDTAGVTPAPLDVNTLSATLTGATGSGVVASGGTGTYTATGFNNTTVGSGKTLAVSLMAGDQQTITGASALTSLNTSFTYNVLGHASGNLSGSTLNLGDVHVGYASPVTSSNSVTASNAAGFLANLKGSATPAGGVTVTSINGITAGSTSGAISATLATGQGPESFSSQTYTFADDSVLSGASNNVGTAAITISGEVYSGQSVWAATGSGSWGTLAGTGAETFGANWGANQGSPGLDPSFTGVDTATFGTVAGGSAADTVNLNAAAPNLNSITFSSSSTSYTLAQGTGANSITLSGVTPSINVTAGAHTISAPVILGAATSVNVASGQMLTLSGAISGGGSLTNAGAGTTTLSHANSYTGGTILSSGTLDVTAAGALPGALTVAGGTLDLGATNQTVGTVNITGASTIQNGTLTGTSYTDSAASGTATVNATLAGIGSTLNKSGGSTLVLNNANSYTGATTISAGTVVVGNPGALGTGIGANVTQNGGTLMAAGMGGAQINVTGNYLQNSGTLVLNLTSNATDLLNVTGSATLNGTLSLNFTSAPAAGQTYEVIETGGGITGTGDFNAPVVSPAGYVVSTMLINSNDDLSVTVVSVQLGLANVPGLTPNQMSTAFYVDKYILPGSPLGSALGAAAGGGSQALGGDLDQLTPEKFGNFTRSTIFNNAAFSTAMFDSYFESQHSPEGDFLAGNGQIDSSGLTVVDPSMDPGLAQVSSRLLAWNPAPLGHGLLSDTGDPVLGGIDMNEMKPTTAPDKGYDYNVFVLGNVVLAQDFSSADVPHADTTTGAVQVGIDYRITPHLRVGALFGYGHTDADLDNIGSKATVDSYSPGAYVSYANNGWYANALGSYGFDNFTEDRHVSFGGLTDVAHGAPNGDQIVGNLDGGYDFHVKKWTFGPTAGVQYTHLDVDSFTEGGADPVDLQVDKQETDSLRSRVGGHVSYTFQAGKVILSPHMDASWQHEFLDQSRGITSQFTSVGAGSFTVNTPSPSRDSALIDGGLSADLNGQVTLYLDYLVQTGQSNYFGQAVQAGVKVGF